MKKILQSDDNKHNFKQNEIRDNISIEVENIKQSTPLLPTDKRTSLNLIPLETRIHGYNLLMLMFVADVIIAVTTIVNILILLINIIIISTYLFFSYYIGWGKFLDSNGESWVNFNRI